MIVKMFAQIRFGLPVYKLSCVRKLKKALVFAEIANLPLATETAKPAFRLNVKLFQGQKTKKFNAKQHVFIL